MSDETHRPEAESSGQKTHSRRRRRGRRGYQGPPAWADRADRADRAEDKETRSSPARGDRSETAREREPEPRPAPERDRSAARGRSGPPERSEPRQEVPPPRGEDRSERGARPGEGRAEGRPREEGERGGPRRRRRRRRGDRREGGQSSEGAERSPESPDPHGRPVDGEAAPAGAEPRAESPPQRPRETPRSERGESERGTSDRPRGARGRPDRERRRRRGRERPEGPSGETGARDPRASGGDRAETDSRRRRARERGERGERGRREGVRSPRRSDDARDRSRRDNGARRGGERAGAARTNGNRRSVRPGLPGPVFAEQPVKPTSVLMMPPKPIRVMIAGGGTGGHIIPALSIGEALKKRNPETELLFLGSDRGLERETIGEAGFRLEEFSLHGLPTRPNVASVRSGWAMLKAYRRIRKLIAEFKPDVVVGTGGYVQVPGILAARAAGIPVVLQEQNSVPGRANRFLSRFASEIHIHFTESRRYFRDRGKLRLSGNPVRIRIAEGRAIRTLQKFRLHADRRTVVILGGSQGAHSLNAAFRDMLPFFRNDHRVQFLIQTGKADYQMVFDGVRDSGVRVVVKSYLHEIEEIYGIAHLVVARAGAMTISELAACGLPSILVPYPHAMDDHQTLNARALSDKGAALLLPDATLTGEVLAREIKALFDDSRRLREMARHAYSLSRPDAARRIAESVERIGGGAPEGVLHLPEQYDLEDEEAIR